jgi:hypothetical protein
MSLRFFTVVILTLTALSVGEVNAKSHGVPKPHRFGPNRDGQYWTVTFNKDGTISAKSTCKTGNDTSCILIGTGTWKYDKEATCYTVATWNGVAYGNPESCFTGN